MMITRTVVALATGVAAFTLAACGPAGVQDTGAGAPASRTATTSPATASATTSPAAEASGTISPPPSTHAPATATHRPAVRHTTAPAVHRTTAPAHRTTAPPAPAVCSIRSNAGNCYKAGQFCRQADLGRTTTDAADRSITCEMVSGRPHWHY